ncbi:unnamed protein product [Rotaria sp. Silwood2]|nr:unnamed protein product [Rotaria sp. Silwood2]
METNEQPTIIRRRDSTTSTISLWDKLPEVNSTFADIANEDDLLDENDDSDNDFENSNDINTFSRSLHERSASNPNLQSTQHTTHLWISEEYNQVKLIVHEMHADNAKKELESHLSSRGNRWIANADEHFRSWHFGLSFICFQLERSRSIDIMRLVSVRHFPFWLRFTNGIQCQRRIKSKSEGIKRIHYGCSPSYRASLRYGALTKMNEFQYSWEHSWSNQPKSGWSLHINNDYSSGSVEWIMERSPERSKKQLLAMNIDHAVIIHLLPDGFAMYICQTCNMNEFSAREKTNNVVRKQPFPLTPHHDRGPLRPSFTDNQSSRRPKYEKYKRSSVQNGVYFSTVQFELRIDPDHLTNENAQNTVRQTYKLLTEFFSSRNITICHAEINALQGPEVNPFPTLRLPTLIMKYAWQMLINIGYRLQIQIDQQFCNNLCQLSREKDNADDLFYRVCVYLSRLFALEPFVNLSDKLHDAVTESKRKRDDSAFGLISSLDVQSNTETYVPSITLTPTAFRIKPLKLCRTNRVLREKQEFGKALENFALVEIRDENGRPLQSFHFRDLHRFFLEYMQKGFTLMDSNRCYQYLHHSKSQLRASQFWFYHHEPGLNRSLEEAYKWMGTFDTKGNVAKCATRIALCFSTTTPTINIDKKNVHYIPDIKTKDGKLTFTDGCGTMSEQLRNDIQKALGKRCFSAVQFRYAGFKGVVSVEPHLGSGYHLCICDSMIKFESEHQCFEVCKISAPRSLYLNRQVILLLSYRQIPDANFLILQQRNHLSLIQALLRNDYARNLLDEKLPYWFLPNGAEIDFVREPFFRQLVIAACLNSVQDLLRRTRIRVPRNKARNMLGIIDEYNVLKPEEVFIQYTQLNDGDNKDGSSIYQKTSILDNCKVVITKNPCHHPGDIRTFTAVKHEVLEHLKDVIVFSQQGDCPPPHQISGSDLDGDEYVVIWHEDLVPTQSHNAVPYDYDSQNVLQVLSRPIDREDIMDIVLKITESDYLGRLSNLHLAYADLYGVDSNKRPQSDLLSTIELAGVISQEVDSGKTGHHPLNDMQIMKQKKALGDKRPDFMENANMKSYQSQKILGKLYRSSRWMLYGWNRLLKQHRHLRHLQVRTPEDNENEIDDEEIQGQEILLDPSFLDAIPSWQDQEINEIASQLFYVYRQEMLEILNLYGLSHESDLWCRKSTNTTGGELEDTAYTQLKQLVVRTQLHHKVAAALYLECYNGQNELERAPILSLPWLFTTALLHPRPRKLHSIEGLLSQAMINIFTEMNINHLLQLRGTTVTFRTSTNHQVEINLDWTVCVFVEILHYSLKSKPFTSWLRLLSKVIYKISSTSHYNGSDDLLLIFDHGELDDEYAAIVLSLAWNENGDELIHSYFIQLLELCFDLGKTINDENNEYLKISEEIILILQSMAIGEKSSSTNRP